VPHARGFVPRAVRASVHIKPVSPPRFCAFFISAATLPLHLYRLTSLRVPAGTAPWLFVFEERLSTLGCHLQVLSPTTRLFSRHQLDRGHDTHSGAANDLTSSKVHRRESCLATVQMKLVSPPRHAEALCLLCRTPRSGRAQVQRD
jgi:hypothetical protein